MTPPTQPHQHHLLRIAANIAQASDRLHELPQKYILTHTTTTALLKASSALETAIQTLTNDYHDTLTNPPQKPNPDLPNQLTFNDQPPRGRPGPDARG